LAAAAKFRGVSVFVMNPGLIPALIRDLRPATLPLLPTLSCRQSNGTQGLAGVSEATA